MINNQIGPTVKHVWKDATDVLHNCFGFVINTWADTAFIAFYPNSQTSEIIRINNTLELYN